MLCLITLIGGIRISPILVVFILILIVVALLIGYLIGNKNLSADFLDEIKKLEHSGKIQTSVIDNVNLGIIAYSPEGAVYSNQTIYDFQGFLNNNKSIPRDIRAFVQAYDQENHLEANYLLNEQNDESVIRANYNTGRRIYEIKILHRNIDSERLDLVIVDDITQIKDDERRQKDLAANVSHELKTPLTVIRASEIFVNSVTENNMPDYAEFKKWGNRIVANAVRMQDIVQDFLILSMCSQNVSMTAVNLEETINKALASIADYPNRNKVNIKVSINTPSPLVYGNANLLMRIIINMLTNGIKYINYEGKTVPNEINVSVVKNGDRFAIQVEDNGRGIPQDSINHLFERFYRVDNSGNRDVGGSGIGLSIAKEIADMHDGSINVNSTIGEGSTFTLVLPTAECVFENIYDDAAAGVISENAYYRSAAEYMATQTVEAVKSIGYDDVMAASDIYEKTPQKDKTLWEKNMSVMFKTLGKDRYRELVEEIIYIDDFDDWDDEDESFVEEDYEEITPNEDVTGEIQIQESIQAAPVIAEQPQKEELSKEEARAILTQPVVLRSAAIKENNTDLTKETIISSTKSEKELYNSNNPEVSSNGGNGEEASIQSAVRKVLDTTTPVPGNTDKE